MNRSKKKVLTFLILDLTRSSLSAYLRKPPPPLTNDQTVQLKGSAQYNSQRAATIIDLTTKSLKAFKFSFF